MLDEQRALRDQLSGVHERLDRVHGRIDGMQERGELTARAIEATRQQVLAQLGLAKIELLDAITV